MSIKQAAIHLPLDEAAQHCKSQMCCNIELFHSEGADFKWTSRTIPVNSHNVTHTVCTVHVNMEM